MIALLSRSYYAKGDTRRPFAINLGCSILIIILSFAFTYLFEHILLFRFFIESLLKVSDIPGTAVLMLPLAYSSGIILNFILHWFFVRKDFMGGESLLPRLFPKSGRVVFPGAYGLYRFKFAFSDFRHYHIFGSLFAGLYFRHDGDSSRYFGAPSFEE